VTLYEQLRELDRGLSELGMSAELLTTLEPDAFVALARTFTVAGVPPALTRSSYHAAWSIVLSSLYLRVTLGESPSTRPLVALPADAETVWTELGDA
jgi:hypothetical protein